MKLKLPRLALVGATVLLYLLHNDFWFRHDRTLLAGWPVGLLYHVGFCLAAAALMVVLVRTAWPGNLE